jgi:hypothetical protein
MLRGQHETFLSCDGGQHFITIGFERDGEQTPNLRFVVNDQN